MPEPVKRRQRWRSAVSLVVVLLIVPFMVIVGAAWESRSSLMVSIGILLAAMVPFFISFERRRPQARELVSLAVMIALAVASRAIFAFVPQFKPMAAVVMITGIAFGANSGFLAGSLAAFVSNFLFGQGPWTPWQMFAFGLAGYVFGFLAKAGLIPRSHWSPRARVLVSLGGYLFIQLIAGPILDTGSLFWMAGTLTPESTVAFYAAGVPFNAAHGLATAVTLFTAGNAFLDKLARLKRKYGMPE